MRHLILIFFFSMKVFFYIYYDLFSVLNSFFKSFYPHKAIHRKSKKNNKYLKKDDIL